MQFTTTAEVAMTNGVKMLVYGPAGMGKTMLCATLPAPLLISAESGLLSLTPANITRVFGADNPAISYNITTVQVQTVEDLSAVYSWLQTSQSSAFQSICIDSISEIAEVVLNNAKRQVKDPRQAYGEMIEKMETLIRGFRDLPGRNVYISAKMEPTKDELSGVIKYGPSMPGNKLGPKIPYFFDEVFRLGVSKTPEGKEFRFLQTQPDLQYEAKDRSGALDPVEYPHLGHIIRKITGA